MTWALTWWCRRAGSAPSTPPTPRRPAAAARNRAAARDGKRGHEHEDWQEDRGVRGGAGAGLAALRGRLRGRRQARGDGPFVRRAAQEEHLFPRPLAPLWPAVDDGALGRADAGALARAERR